MKFDEWIYEVAECISTKSRKDITEVYSMIDLTDAKLAFMDGVAPEEYKIK